MKLSSMQKQKGWSFLVLFFQNTVFMNPFLPIVFLIMLSLPSNFLSQFVLLLPFLLLLNEAPGVVRIKKINNSNLSLLFILRKLQILKEIPSICH